MNIDNSRFVKLTEGEFDVIEQELPCLLIAYTKPIGIIIQNTVCHRLLTAINAVKEFEDIIKYNNLIDLAS